MKKCRKCGAVQDDSHATCIDCGAVLPNPMTDAEEEAHEEALDDKLYGMAEGTDDFYVPVWAKLLGFVCVACFVGTILFLVFTPNRRYIEGEWMVLTFFCAVNGAISLLFPRFVWWLDNFGRRWWYAGGDNLKPSFAYNVVIKAVGVFLTVVAIIGFAALVTTTTRPTSDYARGFISSEIITTADGETMEIGYYVN